MIEAISKISHVRAIVKQATRYWFQFWTFLESRRHISTLEVLEYIAANVLQVRIATEWCRNYLHVITNAPESIEVAWCDFDFCAISNADRNVMEAISVRVCMRSSAIRLAIAPINGKPRVATGQRERRSSVTNQELNLAVCLWLHAHHIEWHREGFCNHYWVFSHGHATTWRFPSIIGNRVTIASVALDLDNGGTFRKAIGLVIDGNLCVTNVTVLARYIESNLYQYRNRELLADRNRVIPDINGIAEALALVISNLVAITSVIEHLGNGRTTRKAIGVAVNGNLRILNWRSKLRDNIKRDWHQLDNLCCGNLQVWEDGVQLLYLGQVSLGHMVRTT